MSVEKDRGVDEFRMPARFPEGTEAVVEEAAWPEAALHGIAGELEKTQPELAGHRPQSRVPIERFAAAVTGDDDESLHRGETFGNPEREGHVLALALSLRRHGGPPLLVGERPTPVPRDGLLGRRRAPFRLIEDPVPGLFIAGLRIRPDPAEAVAFGQGKSLAELEIGGPC